ncbi:hypothetical protein BKP37_09125 [Anaerobacillus alkalilacustris]|uniref:Uncharacterized protein n=1 Tax=Anaerobacillus alkalilacustris TaxID=393763 RepID=A0A1S2LQ32_9BACI|nr:hypothetical protein [Anaerobacillus alkalilacustris]OIJ14233.1 hypothetical protein BKP37_09125 [Anaerobacillus alkalilacustris]
MTLLTIISIVLPLLILFYVISSLSTIKYQLNLIIKNLDIKEEVEEPIPNEQIEKELEDEFLKK